jgi:hypothetical protein
MNTIKSLLDSLQGLEYPAITQDIPMVKVPNTLPDLPDPGGNFFEDIKEQLDFLQGSLDDDKVLSICCTSQSGRSILVKTIALNKYSDLAVISGIDLLDDKDCVILCHIRTIELVIKTTNKETEESEKRPLGFQQITIKG